jgi:HSP20 family protein
MNQFSTLTNLIDRAMERAIDKTLPTNIIENNDGFELLVKVPGISRNDISVDIQGRVVKVSISKMASQETAAATEHVSDAEMTHRNVHLSEFEVPTKAERSFQFREALDADSATLKLEDGILTIMVAYQTRSSKRTLTLR